MTRSTMHKFFDTSIKEEFYVSESQYHQAFQEMLNTQERLKALDKPDVLIIDAPLILNGHEQWIYRDDEDYSKQEDFKK